MTSTARLFKNGQSQAVRLPKEYRFENQEELFIKKVADGVLLMSKNDKTIWNHMFDRLDEFSDDFLNTRAQPTQTREDLF
jgi:antitoxin VapB